MEPRILILLLLITFISVQPKATSESTKLTHLPRHNQDSFPADRASIDGEKLQSFQRSRVVLNGNAEIFSENRTFVLGLFSISGESNWYLGIRYASIPVSTYVWVANRETPIKNPSLARLEITQHGKLSLLNDEDSVVWETDNVNEASDVKLSEQGNLVVLDSDGVQIWQSFDFPTDTWLPGMNLTAQRWLSSWKSSTDPSPGEYSLRLRPPEYGEIALIYNGNYTYWSTGNWTGNAFAGVPQMTIPYIYKFTFSQPFTPMASFGYSEVPIEPGVKPPLTRFLVDHTGQLKQYTWSVQTENWNMFWSQPENMCRVYGLCGNMGFCNSRSALSPCKCFSGFKPWNETSWNAGDFSGGCVHESNGLCSENDGFKEVGIVSYDGARVVSFPGTRNTCEKECLGNCTCIGLHYNERTSFCKNLYGELLNLRNLSSDSTVDDELLLRVRGDSISRKHKRKIFVVIGVSCGVVVILLVAILGLLLLRRRQLRRKEEEEAVFPVTNLKVFSYKELHAATKGFSDKLGHGGFGAVFQGELSDSSIVAVKRLDRPNGGEKEFRAEVCTIGNIQHINLVRLRGFCCENSHRLLVYDYMSKGPLSVYLRRDSQTLSWDVRFRIAMGVARGIAYIHEECRNCIIHCDIKPENILLDEDYSAKVSDFGLAKLLGRDFSRVLATMRGTWGYVAPEWISGLAITTKADVYSYGMTILELIGGRRNVEGPPSSVCGGDDGKGRAEEKWFFPPWAAQQIIEGNIAAVVDEKLQGRYNTSEAERVGLVGVWCIQDEESVRPTMGMVVKMLEGVVEVQVPPPPKLLQALVSGESFHGKMGSQDDASAGSSAYNPQLSIDSHSLP